jgi:hypothetical protein
MAVWLAAEKAKVRPTPEPTIASRSTLTASKGNRRAGRINNLYEPSGSADRATGYLYWWPNMGTVEWVQYDFPKAERISETAVYWYDNPETECRVPVLLEGVLSGRRRVEAV